MAVTIRPATADDAETVAHVHNAGWKWAYAGIIPASYLAGLDAKAAGWAREWRARMADPSPSNTELLVADDGGTVIGFINVGPYRIARDPAHVVEAEGEVRAIYVVPERTRGGIGTLLLRVGLERLAAAGRSPVRLWVLTDNVRARAFYSRMGFAPDGKTGSFRLVTEDGPVDLAELRYTRA